jgi:protein-tyrosine phosphatase
MVMHRGEDETMWSNDPDRLAAELSRRVIPLAGGRNFRDMGGYAGLNGRPARWRTAYRSGAMTHLTPQDHDELADRAIRLVVDLRTTTERTNEPNAWAIASQDLQYWARDYDHNFAELHRVIRQPDLTVAEMRAAMIDGYSTLPFDQAESFAQLFTLISEGHAPFVVNCSAGKDRTGMAAALLLSAIGVPRETVVADFALTDHAVDLKKAFDPRTSAQARDYVTIDPAVTTAALRSDPDYLAAALDAIARECGSVEGYIRDVLAIDNDRLEALRETLLEPEAG